VSVQLSPEISPNQRPPRAPSQQVGLFANPRLTTIALLLLLPSPPLPVRRRRYPLCGSIICGVSPLQCCCRVHSLTPCCPSDSRYPSPPYPYRASAPNHLSRPRRDFVRLLAARLHCDCAAGFKRSLTSYQLIKVLQLLSSVVFCAYLHRQRPHPSNPIETSDLAEQYTPVSTSSIRFHSLSHEVKRARQPFVT